MNAAVQNLKGISHQEWKAKKRATQIYAKMAGARKQQGHARIINEEAKTKTIYANQGIYVPTDHHASAMRAEGIAKGITGAIAGAGKIVASAFGGPGADSGGGGAEESGGGGVSAGVPQIGQRSGTNNSSKRMYQDEPENSSSKRTKKGKKLTKNKTGQTPAANNQMMYLMGGIAVLAVLIVIMKR
jgi:hypothetical protein